MKRSAVFNKVLAAACMLVILTGLVLQWRSIGVWLESQGDGVVARSLQFVSWFTVLTNLLCGCCCLRIVFGKTLPDRSFMAVPCSAILTVCLVAAFVLKSPGDLKAIARTADLLLHYGSPPLFIGLWWLCPASKHFRRPIIMAAGYSIGYASWIFLRGGIMGFYPYPFVDPAFRGLTSAVAHVLIMFVLYGAILAILLLVSSHPVIDS